MSQATSPEDDNKKDDDWLRRNARPLDVQAAREAESESWTRAQQNAGDDSLVEPGNKKGFAVVQLPDGDPHLTVIAEAEGDGPGPFVGACDCDGFHYQDGPCAHLLLRAVRSVIRSAEVPTDASLYSELKEAGGDDNETDQDVGNAMSDVGGLEEDAGDDQDDVVDVPAAGPDANVAMPNTAGDPFASELRENVPERFVMDLGGEPYIRRAGFAAIARQAGLGVEVDAITPAEDTEFQHARYVATVRDQDGNVLGKDVGTARLEFEDLAGAEAQLDELAATRACRRAIEWATGAGATLRRDA